MVGVGHGREGAQAATRRARRMPRESGGDQRARAAARRFASRARCGGRGRRRLRGRGCSTAQAVARRGAAWRGAAVPTGWRRQQSGARARGGGASAHLRGLLHHLLVGGLGEEHLHVRLLALLGLGPLLLALLATGSSGHGLLLLRLLLHLRRLREGRGGARASALAFARCDGRQRRAGSPASARTRARARRATRAEGSARPSLPGGGRRGAGVGDGAPDVPWLLSCSDHSHKDWRAALHGQ